MTDWYVSQLGAGLKNGTSLDNAWAVGSVDGAGDAAWAGMAAGDTLWVSGALHGILSFAVGASGSESGGYLTIQGIDDLSGVVLGVEKAAAAWSGPDAYGAYSCSYSNTVKALLEWSSSPLDFVALANAGRVPDGTWTAGNYYYDTETNTLYWKPSDGSISGKTCTIDAMLSFNLDGLEWVRIKHMRFASTRLRVGYTTASNHIWIDDCVISHIASFGVGVYQTSSYGRVSNCEISYAKAGGVYCYSNIGALGWMIDHNYIHDIGGGNYTGDDGHGIGVQYGHDYTICDNTIINSGGSAIELWCGLAGTMKNHQVFRNFIRNAGVDATSQTKGNGINISGTNGDTLGQRTGISIFYNIVVNAGVEDLGSSSGYGIVTNNPDPQNIWNNVVVNSRRSGIQFNVTDGRPAQGSVRNNIVVNSTGPYAMVWGAAGSNTVTFDYNIYWPNAETGANFYDVSGGSVDFAGWQSLGYDANSLAADPMLAESSPTAPSGAIPSIASPALGAGESLGLFLDFSGDVVSASPSIGAFEKGVGEDMSLYTLISGVASAADVRYGVARYAGGDAGTCQVPSASDVWHGVAVDATTGTKRASSIPNCVAGNIRSGVAIDDVTGSYGALFNVTTGGMRASSKEKNVWRSFCKFIMETLSSYSILYGDEVDAFPDRVDKALDSKSQFLVITDTRYAGGRGDAPCEFEIAVVTRKISDPSGALAEEARDAVRNALNAPVSLYDFSDRANPVAIGGNYNLYPVYVGSLREDERGEPVSQWTMRFQIYSDKSDSKF